MLICGIVGCDLGGRGLLLVGTDFPALHIFCHADFKFLRERQSRRARFGRDAIESFHRRPCTGTADLHGVQLSSTTGSVAQVPRTKMDFGQHQRFETTLGLS